MSDPYDKASRLNIGQEDLEQAVFKKTASDKIAYRIGNEAGEPLTVADAGTPIFSPELIHLKTAQTKNVEGLVGTVTIALNEIYDGFTFNVTSIRLFKWRAAYVDDASGAATETNLGFGYTDAGELNVVIDRKKTKIDTSGGTAIQEVRLYATPLDKTDEIYAQFYFNKLPA